LSERDLRVPEPRREIDSYIRVPAFATVTDDPALPRVLLIGDSISIYYTPEVRRLLQGRANLHRVPDNGRSTRHGLEHLEAWLGGDRWAVIHCNFGLHDIAQTSAGAPQVPIQEYAANLGQILSRLQETGARLVWATTTPVPEGSGNRREADALDYNLVAGDLMTAAHVPINDLHAFIAAREDLYRLALPANVHFRAEGSVVLGGEVAGAILGALG
jgi:hypothetical protein